MVIKWLKRILLTSVGIALIGVLLIVVLNRLVTKQSNGLIKTSITEIPAEDPPRVAIVFGARVFDDGRLSNSLYDRVLTGAELYRAGRTKKLLMSGDRQSDAYDEPAAMKKFAIELGVPESDIEIDNDGKRTRDTCDRAKSIYGVDRTILVTQDYHQPRAIYFCKNAGIDTIGINANRRTYDREDYYHFREFFAVAGAWFETTF